MQGIHAQRKVKGEKKGERNKERSTSRMQQQNAQYDENLGDK